MIKNIVFDIDGVIKKENLGLLVEDVLPASLKKKYAGKLKNLTLSEYVNICDNYGGVREFDAGKISTEQFFETALANAKDDAVVSDSKNENGQLISEEVVKAVYSSRLKKSVSRPFNATIKLINLLHDEGFNLYILSNVNEFLLPAWKATFDESKFVDAIYSCEVGMIKPNAEIYKFALKKWKIKAEETLLVDDQEANLAPFTRLLGYTALFDQSAKNEDKRIYDYICKINKIAKL